MRIAISFFCFVLSAGPALAINCGKAATPVEKAICGNPALLAKDDALSAVYGEIRSLSTGAERKMLAKSQRQWIAGRETGCAGPEGAELIACVAKDIDERMVVFSSAPQSGPGYPSRMIPVFMLQDGGKGIYSVDFALMRFADAKTPGERRLNSHTGKIVKDAPLGVRTELADIENLATESAMAVSYASPELLSVLTSFYSDGGGAHGNGGVENLNINMTTGKEVEISDVFSENAAAALAKQCRAQIIAQKKGAEGSDSYDPATDNFLKDEVIAEHIATFSRWSLRESEAVVSFDSYAIGAYAEGPFDCKFPMTDLKALALPGAPLP